MFTAARRCTVRRTLVPILTVLALSSAMTARAAHENIMIDGNLTDLITAINNNLGPDRGGFTVADPAGDTYTMPCGYVNGYDIIQSYLLLDFTDANGDATPNDVTLYVGWDMDGIVGDVDGDGNPNTFNINGPGGSTGCALSDEAGIGPNESYNVLLDLDCTGGVDDIRLQVKDNTVSRVVNNVATPLPGATFAFNGDKLELRIPNYQDLLTGLMINADLCDARFRLTANAAFDGPGEDLSAPLQLALSPSILVEKNPPTRSICAGTEVSWTITVTNDGICVLHDVNVEDVLGTGMSFTASNTMPTSVVGQTVRWEFPGINLAPGGTINLTLDAATASPCASGTLTNNVTAEGVHLTPCLPMGTPSPSASDKDSATITCRDLPTCDIAGDTHTCFPSSETYTTEVTDPFTRLWSFSSTPPGICNTSDPLDGGSVTVNFTGAGVCTVSLTISDPLNPQTCSTTCDYLVQVEAEPPCSIIGIDQICAMNSSTFNTNVGPDYSKSWSVTSTPDNICTTSGATDGDMISINFIGAGQCTISLRVGDPEDPADCMTICTRVVTVEACVDEPDLCWMTGGGCLNEPVRRGHKAHTFGGNVGPPPSGSWEHIVREKNKILFNFHSWDAQVDSCWNDGGDGPCSPRGEINNIAWSGTGLFSIGSGMREEEATFVAHVEDRGEPGSHDGNCGSKDFYEITVFRLDGSVAFQAGDYITCGNLQIHPFHGNQGFQPIDDWRTLIEAPPVAGADLLSTRPLPNPVTTSVASINYSIPSRFTSADVRITIFDVTGRALRTIAPGKQPAGDYSVDWDLTDEDGSSVTSGIYFYRLTVGTESITEKLMVVRK